MNEDAEIEVPEEAAAAAAELSLAVRRATADLPFGIEPLDFLVVRDTLAESDGSDDLA